jgi:hypothetical protein
MPSTRKPRRARGEVELLPSGSYRVRVYAGLDPLTRKRHYLVETVPAGNGAEKQAEKVRTRLLGEVDERRAPRTNPTVAELLDRYLDIVEVEDTTRAGYERMADRYIKPLLGEVRIGRIDGEVLDTFYARLRRCRAHRSREHPKTDHRTEAQHSCDGRCVTHTCRPLGASYLRQIHVLMNGAFARAVKCKWVGVNPIAQAEAPPQPPPDPQPPTPGQAAQIVAEAFKDPDWGMLVWLAMTTGARRGELCALRWDRLDLAGGVLDIRTSMAQINTRIWEKDPRGLVDRPLAAGYPGASFCGLTVEAYVARFEAWSSAGVSRDIAGRQARLLLDRAGRPGWSDLLRSHASPGFATSRQGLRQTGDSGGQARRRLRG